MVNRTRSTELKHWLGEKHAYELLHSEGQGLYEEMDKLCKKAPSETITSLQTRVINEFILRAKTLLTGDPILDVVSVFVPAGDNPEYRDVLTVLRQTLQGLQRYKVRNSFLWSDDFEDELADN